MKKIIIVINNFETGGVQKSLLNLLKEIKNEYDITLLSFFGNSEFEKEIPKEVKTIILGSPYKHLGMSKKHIQGMPVQLIARTFWFFITKIFGRTFTVRLMGIFQRKLKGYDYAISYLHEVKIHSLHGGCNTFVLQKIKAKEKIAWIHCDFHLNGANNVYSREIYKKFDKIIACSEGCRQSFIGCFPEFTEKTKTVRNCNEYIAIKTLAGNGIAYDQTNFNIVTVARLAKEKGIERALEAISACCKAGHRVMYHIVGDGNKEQFLKDKVIEFGLENNVVFYGNQNNPYPYIKNADLFLLTSYHEAAPMVFDEAACLCVPILATKTTSTDEMIVELGAGFVCDNSQNAINDALLDIITHKEKLIPVTETLRQYSFDNSKSVSNLKRIIEGGNHTS